MRVRKKKMTDLKLYKHQQEFLLDNPDTCALVWGTGTGKSYAGILWANRKGEPAIFVVPKMLKTKWERDLEKMCSVQYALVTKEEFRRDWDSYGDFPTVVIDESHFFLGMKSQMSKSLGSYLKKWSTPYRLMMSANAYRSSAWDVYMLAQHLGHPLNYRLFDQMFFYKVQMGGRFIPMQKDNIEDDLARIVHRIGDIKSLEDCADVPQQVDELEFFSMNPDQKKLVKDMGEFNPVVRYGKEHQITGGTMKGDEYSEDLTCSSQKRDRTLELIKDNRKVLVVCKYSNELSNIKLAVDKAVRDGDIPKDTVVKIIDGKTPNRQGILDTLERSENYVLIAQAQLGVGWELASCPMMIFYSLPWSYVDYSQMRGRILRVNALKKNVYVHLVVEKTVDEAVYNKVVIEKGKFDAAIYDGSTVSNKIRKVAKGTADEHDRSV